MKLEDLLTIYDQEKKIKVNVILADRESRKLVFFVKPKEKEEPIQRKRNLMANKSNEEGGNQHLFRKMSPTMPCCYGFFKGI
ncbi:unnamed protein product [Lactuca virosa]|uniref:Uncharacterized protein n=1 Tax=Lactuca virosa TaxID=75947 RepID=A0AAU9NF74_9ASTR|nr:unnamed protein product [Lactuca virosa]